MPSGGRALLLLLLMLAVLAQATDAAAQTSPPGTAPPRVEPSQLTGPSATTFDPSPAIGSPAPGSMTQATTAAGLLSEGLSTQLAEIGIKLDTADRLVFSGAVEGGQLNQLRSELEIVTATAARIAQELKPRLDAVRSQIGKLGATPAKDGLPEPPAIAAERLRLSGQLIVLDGALKSTELAQVRARQLIGRIQELVHTDFTRMLFQRTDSPLSPALWSEVVREGRTGLLQVTIVFDDWWSRARLRLQALMLLGLIVAALAIALGAVSRRLIRRSRARMKYARAPFFERAAGAIWVAPLRTLALAIPALTLYHGLAGLALLPSPSDALLHTALDGFLLFAAVSALAMTLLEPRATRWRLFDLDDASAARLLHATQAVAAVYAGDLVFRELNRVLYAPLSLTVAQSFIASLAFAALLLAALLTPLGSRPTADSSPPESAQYFAAGSFARRVRPWWLKLPLAGMIIAIISTAVLGYVALARFLSGQVVLTGSLLVVVILLHLAVRALAGEIVSGSRPMGKLTSARFGLDTARRRQLAVASASLLNLLLALIALPLLALQWGFAWADVRSWLSSAFFGFEVGTVRVSLGNILLSLLVFTGFIFATRLLQRWLAQTVLRPPRMEAGLANSIYTVVGWLGVALAVLFSVPVAGVDFTNLVIVASALSVGIGFGLQSIVNNFVSGLVLLIERPVKVGDWVVIGRFEGYVRRISVRSTELETLDRASVIVPNSELVTSAVINWTHRNSVGRLIIKVGVDMKADPEQVCALLTEVGRAHPAVLTHPKPLAVFDEFGASTLDFSLRVCIADINQRYEVLTDLRIAMLKALRAAGIELPYPQSDIHLRDLDTARSAINAFLESRRQQAEAENSLRVKPAGNIGGE